MSKRFTDTEIWDKSWFMDLDPVKKCLVRYVFDKCDQAGIWSPNWKLASTYIGQPVSESDLIEINPCLFEKLPGGKILIVKFVSFQYGTLTDKCAPHKKVIQILKENGIYERVTEGYCKGNITLQEKEEEKDMDKEEEGVKEKEKEKKAPKFENEIRVIEYYNQATGRKASITAMSNIKPIAARLKEGLTEQDLYDIVDFKQVEWTGTEMEKHLVIETLFGNKAEKYRTQVQNAKDKGLTAAQIKGKPNGNGVDHTNLRAEALAAGFKMFKK